MAQNGYHHENLREELIQAGLQLLDEGGYDHISLRAVAGACGVSHAAPYRHFRNKDELVFAIASHILHRFNQSLQAAVDLYPDDPGRQLREMGYRYVLFFVENPAYLRLIFLNKDSLRSMSGKAGNESLASLEDPFQIFQNTIGGILRARAGSRSEEDAQAMMLSAWGLVHGIAVLLTKGDFHYEGDVGELVRKALFNFRSVS